jgi:6-phosphofructokinase 1
MALDFAGDSVAGGESSMVKKIAVLTSGGDSQGMNAAIRAVVRSGVFHGLEVYGVYRGFQGLIENDIQPLTLPMVGDILNRGGTILGTARSQQFLSEEGQRLAAGNLERHGIDGLIVIGGNGSYKGAVRLERLGIPTVALPGTIDNDIACTERTIGFDTAVSIVVDAVNRLRDTFNSQKRLFIVEVMGRHCGDIALHSALASGAEGVVVPEMPHGVHEVITRIAECAKRGKGHSIVILAEGAGKGSDIARKIRSRCGMESRVTVLGHIQRGGSPTHYDRILATRLGHFAVERLIAGDHGIACGVSKSDELVATDIEKVVSSRKTFNVQLYNLVNNLGFVEQ